MLLSSEFRLMGTQVYTHPTWCLKPDTARHVSTGPGGRRCQRLGWTGTGGCRSGAHGDGGDRDEDMVVIMVVMMDVIMMVRVVLMI